MEDSTRLRSRTVGRNTSSSYRDFLRIRPSPYPLTTPSSPVSRPRYSRRSLSPPKRKNSPSYSDRFIPYSSPISLRHILSSPPPTSPRDGSQSPTNPQLSSPGKSPEWPNSYDDKIHSHRLASALDLPISPKLLNFHSPPMSPAHPPNYEEILPSDPPFLVRKQQRTRHVPPDPYRILDAPELRDDYYTQPLGWSIHGSIAVALGVEVFLWHPNDGVTSLPLESLEDITSVTFNSTGDILAIARGDGSVLLHSPTETSARILIAPIISDSIGALAWRPSRPPQNPLQEYLVIGTFDGQVILVEVTWHLDSIEAKVEKRGYWSDVHTDQICGIAWSNDGLSFATGANDNKVITFEIPMGKMGSQNQWERQYEWIHYAAVKALTYKSGKGGILAAGGGVHDKKIRFYNTFHGTLVSSLDVDAQITTLIWSPTTTEILATFGYTSPGIKTKCAVYAYPSLQCLFAFEIADEIRALYAVVSPSGGDICLAGSDECVRFYRIWGNTKEGDDNKSRESSPVRDLIEGVDGQFQQQNTTRRRLLRSGLSVIR